MNVIFQNSIQTGKMAYQEYQHRLVASVVLRLDKLLPPLSTYSYGDSTLNELVMLCDDIKSVGLLLDTCHRQKMDSMQTVFTKICQDMKIDVRLRLKVLEIIELRTLDWISNEAVENYYKEKFALIESGKSRSISSRVVNEKPKKDFFANKAVFNDGVIKEGSLNLVQAIPSKNLKEQALSESRGLVTYSRNDILLLANSPYARVQPVHWNKVVSTLPAVIVRSPSKSG